jgi:uncharacterized protein (DUF1778 family)
MSRFQAQTTAILDEELSDLRERLGLRENQKADLLYEIAMLAAWVIRQAEAGRRIEARRGREVETLQNFVIERLSRKHAGALTGRIDLADTEVERLAEILDQGFSPTPALREALARLADPKRQPPRLRWQETKA